MRVMAKVNIGQWGKIYHGALTWRAEGNFALSQIN